MKQKQYVKIVQINKSTSYNNIFFICFDCKKNLCQLCKSLRDKTHNIIDYDDKFFTCELHYESYYSYCEDCIKDLCISCASEHGGYKILTYGSLLPNIKKLKDKNNNFNTKIEAFKNDIKDIINKLNDLMYSIDNYYPLYQRIINSYGNTKINYFLLPNINDINIFNNEIIDNIDKITNNKNISTKFNDIFDIYEKMDTQNKANPDNDDKSNIIIDIKEEKKEKDIKEKTVMNEDKKEEPNGKEKEENKDSNDNEETDKNINKNNKIIELDNELVANSEKNLDNNYKDFDVSKIKNIITFKTEIYYIKEVFVLKDERIIIYGSNISKSKALYYVIDIKNGNQ